jgi:VCBS repeat-containing protein
MPSRRPNSRPRRPALFERLESRLPLAADITTGLVHHWTFDETSGDTAADSAGNAPGTLVNWQAGQPKWEPGRVNGALRFSSTGSYVITPFDSTPVPGSFALSFWLNVEDRQGPNARIIAPKGGNVVFINHESNRSVSFLSNAAVDFSNAAFTPSAPTFNGWEHYALNFNAATGQGIIYRSGAPVAIANYNDFPHLGSWVIGHHEDLGNHGQTLDGALDDFRMYHRVLTDEDIAALANLGTPQPTHVEPIHHWTFDETTGFTANDIAGDADGTLLNWNQTEPRWEPGKVGGALRFSTIDNAVVTAPVSVGAAWSVAFWVNLADRDSLFPRVVGPNDGRELWAYFNNQDGDGGGFLSHEIGTFEPSPPSLNAWHHYAFTYDTLADVGNVYRNGRLVASGVFHDNPVRQALVFGHNRDLGNHDAALNGLLDDLRVYDRLLAVTEIQELAQVAVNDAYSTNEDLLLDITAAQGLLGNDTSAPPRITTVEADPLHGDLVLNEDGSFTYDPDNDYNGPDSFTYRLTDSQDNFSIATVALTINPVNDAPTFNVTVEQFLTSDEQPRVFRSNGDPVPSTTFPEWTQNRVPGPPTADEADQNLTLSVSNDNNALFVDQPSVDHNGTLYFTPAPNAAGVAVLTVTLKDSGGTALGGIDTTTQTIQITIVKPHPRLNVANSQDVLPDGTVAPNDALEVINFLNAFGSQPVPPNFAVAAPFLDVTGDNVIAPDDALEIINVLNAGITTIPDLPGSASFVRLDTTTQGSWIGQYGSTGYALNSAQTSVLPSDKLSFTGALTDLYDAAGYVATTDPRALQVPGTTDRIAASWLGDHGFTLDINITNGQSREVALYMLDSDRNGRSQRLEVIDATTDQVLDTRDVSDFGDGIYLIWNLSGHVKIRFTNLANGLNATLSGIFFD